MKEISLESVGLLDAHAAAEHFGCHVRTVQRWIAADLLPAVVVNGGGRNPTYLIRRKDLNEFEPPKVGRRKK